ncbi:MAG: YjjG family noncanonical pyrimidine nucleotidase [Bacteroidales bacterium]
MRSYKHIFFDLDRTLWDFETNAKEAFKEIFDLYKLSRIFQDFETFHSVYNKHNGKLWEKFRNGDITKKDLKYRRFYLTLKEYGKDDLKLAKQLGEEYMKISARKTRLLPHSHEVLSYLQDKYFLYIITNGFHEAQLKKIENSDLRKYFEKIITSDSAGVQKPHGQIFRHALKQANARTEEAIMVGDDIEGDIKGARDIGLDQVFFNPEGKTHYIEPTFEIRSLIELKTIF